MLRLPDGQKRRAPDSRATSHESARFTSMRAIAMKGHDEADCFADNQSLLGEWRQQQYRLQQGEYAVRVRSSDGVDETFHCELVNRAGVFDLRLLADTSSSAPGPLAPE